MRLGIKVGSKVDDTATTWGGFSVSDMLREGIRYHGLPQKLFLVQKPRYFIYPRSH